MPVKKPNILFITTDMQRWDTLGCYGNQRIQTPNIDAIATQGIRFDNAFVNSPVCCPSRATFFTGKVPSAHGVRWNNTELAADETTVSKLLQDAGYYTAAIGKMHWGEAKADYGFDYINVTDYGGATSEGVQSLSEYREERGYADIPHVSKHPDYRKNFGAVPSLYPEDGHLDGFIGHATERFLEDREPDKPFFCWCSFFGPHLPIDPSPPWHELYDPKDMPLPPIARDELDGKPIEQKAFQRNSKRGNDFGDYRAIVENPEKLRRFIALYWAKISMIDSFIGKIMQKLEALGLEDDTIVVFTTDHGDFVGHHQLLFKSAFLYDDLVKVPLIISQPKRWQSGARSQIVESCDLAATFMDLAGIDAPRDIQGESLLPLLDDKNAAGRSHAYAEAVDQKMIRTDRWKLVYYGGRGYGELYDLQADPGERFNLYSDTTLAETKTKLMQALFDRIGEIESQSCPPVHYTELEMRDASGRLLRIPQI